jgi:radical SAM superfamily enzyme YgiQ (UPF0313 family)
MHSVLAGRGCPNRCSYCSNHALRAAGHGKYVRFRSPAGLVREVEQIVANYSGVKSIYFEIETLAGVRTYPNEICSALEEFIARTGSTVLFGTNLAPNKHILADPELPTRLKRAHFSFVNLGLESGSERIRHDVLRRPPYTNTDLVRFCETVRAAGLELQLYVMLGIPGETLADYDETIELTRSCRPSNVLCSIFYPYPGTDLHETCKKLGLVHDDLDARPHASTLERCRATLDLPEFPKWRIQLEYLLFPYRAFKGKKSSATIAANTARALLGSSPGLIRLYRKLTASDSMLGAMKSRISSASR